MNYFDYLLLFIIFPSIVLAVFFAIRVWKSSSLTPIIQFGFSFSILALVAFIYTTPWDNYLVASGIWFYDPSKIIGIVYGYVPLEEYSFFILETLLICLVASLLIQFNYIDLHFSYHSSSSSLKMVVLGLLSSIWILCLFSYLLNINSMKYMNLLFLWALPPIILQLIIGWDVLLHNKLKLTKIIFLATLYLSLTDAYAIYSGIWTINATYTIGLIFFVIPVEEILFFLITVILILNGYILITYYVNLYFINHRPIVHDEKLPNV